VFLDLWKKEKETASKYPQETAIRQKKDDEWNDLSFKELQENITHLAAVLKDQGITKGERIAICLENRPEWPVIFFAAMALGSIAVPISPASGKEDIQTIIKDSGTKIVFTNKNLTDQIKEVCEECSSVERVIDVDTEEFKNLPEGPGKELAEAEIAEDDLACILYTSGTTAVPKGVMLTQGNLLANYDSLEKMNLASHKDRVISILPLYHSYALMGTMIMPLILGGQIIYPASIKSEDIFEAMNDTHPTIFVAVPQIYYAFYQRIKDKLSKISFPLNVCLWMSLNIFSSIRKMTGVNLSRFLLKDIHEKFGGKLNLFVTGGARFDEHVEKKLFKFGFPMMNGYGLTETSPLLTLNPLGKGKIGSVGLPVPDVEIKVVGKNKEGVGEVAARGRNIMKGYYKREDETRAVIKDGWFYTGDLGFIDKDGYLFLTGRSKEVIVLSSGVNIYPEEIEEAYSKSTSIKDICVFEVPDKKTSGENLILWAVVVPDLEDIKKHGDVNIKHVIKEWFKNVSETLPAQKRLMGFSITLDELSRTLLGKIKRYEVKERYLSGAREEREHVALPKELSKEDMVLMESDVAGKIISYLENTTHKKPVSPDDILELDLGIDSLGRVELTLGLEEALSEKINDEIIGKSFTVRELVAGVKSFLEGGEYDSAYSEREESWKDLLEESPSEETLNKIELNPGFGTCLFAFLFRATFYSIFKLFYNLKIEGRENIPDAGSCIVYVNHSSFFDGFLVATSVPRNFCLNLFFMGFRVYFTAPIVHHLIKIGRGIPLDLSSHLLETLRSASYILKNGKNLCMFPEGMRTFDGEVHEFKKGFGILAKEAGVKLMPVALIGTYEAWPRTRKFPRRHPITVRFGKPIDIEEAEELGMDMGAKDEYEAICTVARDILVKLK